MLASRHYMRLEACCKSTCLLKGVYPGELSVSYLQRVSLTEWLLQHFHHSQLSRIIFSWHCPVLSLKLQQELLFQFADKVLNLQ